jgi:hypothetical protein
MFSDIDINTFSLELELPHFEEKRNVVEEFMGKFPLSTMKFNRMQTILITLRETTSELPTMALEGDGVSLYLAKRSLRLSLNKEKTIGVESGKEKVEDIQPFSEDNLKHISNDFNFAIAGIIGLLGLTSLKAEANIMLSKDVEKESFFDRFLVPDFWSRLQECKEKHVSGFQIEFLSNCMGTNTECRIRLASETREEKEEKKKIITINEKLQFVLKGPLDLYATIKERLETINAIYDNLTGDA